MAIVSESCFRHLGLRLATHLAFAVIAEESRKMESEGCTQSMRPRLLFDSISNGASPLQMENCACAQVHDPIVDLCQFPKSHTQ